MLEQERLVYSIPEVARILGVSQTTIQYMIQRKQIPFMILGERRYVIPKVELEKWMGKRVQLPEDMTEKPAAKAKVSMQENVRRPKPLKARAGGR